MRIHLKSDLDFSMACILSVLHPQEMFRLLYQPIMTSKLILSAFFAFVVDKTVQPKQFKTFIFILISIFFGLTVSDFYVFAEAFLLNFLWFVLLCL